MPDQLNVHITAMQTATQTTQPLAEKPAEPEVPDYSHLIGTIFKAACFKCGRNEAAKEFVVKEVKAHKKTQTNTIRAIGECKVCGTKMSSFVGTKKKEIK